MNKNSFIKNLLSDLEIPKGKIIVAHVKLKDIKKKIGADYEELTREILNVLNDFYNPETIIAPTFTYTFTKSGVFHKLFSKSETGRFSEEVRLNFADYRTNNPIFSFADVNGYFENIDLDNDQAFGGNSIFKILHDEDCIIMNIGLDKLISSQLHFVEKQNNVNYRYYKNFSGVIYKTEKFYEEVEYKYYVRDLERDPQWDRKKIKKYFCQKEILKTKKIRDIEVNWISAQDKYEAVSEKLKSNDEYLIESN